MHRPSLSSNPIIRPVVVLLAAFVLVGGGCESAGQGAVTGASVGALSGLALGSLSGNAGAGAAAGAVIGGVAGGVIGDQNARERDYDRTVIVREPRRVYRAEPDWRSRRRAYENPVDRARIALSRFEGDWEVDGWVLDDRYEQVPVSGWAYGYVDHRYFIDIEFEHQLVGEGDIITGEATIASEPGRGITLTARFSSSPSRLRFVGDADRTGDTIRLRGSNLRGSGLSRDAEILIRFVNEDRWIADVSDRVGGRKRIIESYTYSRAD
ncbi:MAG: hypothetical protein AAGB51_00025 [Planctomycetota bacterium]